MQKESNGKRTKTPGSEDENGCSKVGGETGSAGGNKNADKSAEQLKDYIHVRARRGQATDSHSLAERVIFFLILETFFFLVLGSSCSEQINTIINHQTT